MKFQVMESNKIDYSKVRTGDFISYTMNDGELIVGMIVHIRSNEYRFLNLKTGLTGSNTAYSQVELVKDYERFKDLRHYSREEYTLSIILEEVK